ncbi:RrF2 family transcriptional regulator [Salipiger mucosus]|uniref:Nitrite-sensitive transcriptional repressor NsrR n=1 Tax=Salipiger mucosus DSM 16094 TaxID=1123237 RepID=S9RND3_9RHOB|nr:Rrf2 family transcriptional regulator [Salipiger mucosus]EPX79580.1 Nitrite-sensitive transcriptional repressor NsrR [Salipiger mucosus DSM 16094]
MKLSKFTDYAMRVCLYLGAHDDRRVSIAEIAKAHDLSHANLMKVVQQLVEGGFLKSTRGRLGGVQLAREASAIRVGDVARHMEGCGMMVDCASCILQANCGLVPVLAKAQRAFFAVLDEVTLEEAVHAHPATVGILQAGAPPAKAAG